MKQELAIGICSFPQLRTELYGHIIKVMNQNEKKPNCLTCKDTGFYCQQACCPAHRCSKGCVPPRRQEVITNVERVMELANLGRSIFSGITHKIVPAAFMQNYQGRVLWQMVNTGKLFEYEPKAKQNG